MKRLAAVLLLTICGIVNCGCSETDMDDVTETIVSSFTTEAEATEPAAETFFELEEKLPNEPEYYGDPVPAANADCDIPLEFVPYDVDYFNDIQFDFDELEKRGADKICLGHKCRQYIGEVYNSATDETYIASLLFDVTDGSLVYVSNNLGQIGDVYEDVFPIDFDNDGSMEIFHFCISKDYLIDLAYDTCYARYAVIIDSNEGSLVYSDLLTSLNDYFKKDWKSRGGDSSELYVRNLPTDILSSSAYFVVTRPEAGYTYVQNKLEYAGGGYDIVDSYERTYDMFAPYTSNSDDWSVEVSYKELYVNEFIGRRSYYGIGIFGTNGKKYYYYMEDNINRSPIIFGSGDERSTRALVVNEELGYALLIYPRFTDTADTVLYDNIAVIDLSNGDIVYQYYDSVMVAKELVGEELGDELVNGTNVFGMNSHYVKTTAEPSDGGFELTIEAFLDGVNETFITRGKMTYNPDSEQLFDVENY